MQLHTAPNPPQQRRALVVAEIVVGAGAQQGEDRAQRYGGIRR